MTKTIHILQLLGFTIGMAVQALLAYEEMRALREMPATAETHLNNLTK